MASDIDKVSERIGTFLDQSNFGEEAAAFLDGLSAEQREQLSRLTLMFGASCIRAATRIEKEGQKGPLGTQAQSGGVQIGLNAAANTLHVAFT